MKGVMDSSSMVKESCCGQACDREVLERPFHEVMNLKPGLHWRPQVVGDARAMGYLPTQAIKRNVVSPDDRSVKQPMKLEEKNHLINTLTSDIEPQSLEFAPLGFILALVQCFLAMSHIL